MYKRITKKDIKNFIDNKPNPDIDYEPFIVMKEMIGSAITHEVSWIWKVICCPLRSKNNSFIVEKQDALAIIENMDMTPALVCKYGKIFEMQGKPYLKKYKGKSNLISDTIGV